MKVLIADDHPMVRDALARTVRRAVGDAEVHEAQDFAAAECLCEALMFDMVLLDLNMPGMNGLEGIRRLRQRHPDLAVIVASGQEDPPTIRAVLATGVMGFFPKSATAELF